MNGSSTMHYPVNEQLIGKFHVTSVDKLPVNPANHHDDCIPPTSSTTDETGCISRFQMIRVDRNFGRGRWKVNDYEPPENISTVAVLPVNTMETESNASCLNGTCSNAAGSMMPTVSANMSTAINSDSNITSSATAASAATVFQQQRMTTNNTPTLVPVANVQPQTGLLHAYPSPALANQQYLLSNHQHQHQFGYYPLYAPPYSHYAATWAAAMMASNPYLAPSQQQMLSQMPPTTNHHDPNRLGDTDINGDTTMMSSSTFANATAEHVQNAQFAAASLASFLYGAHHSHSSFAPPTSSPYATIPSYHPMQHPSILVPSNHPPQSFSASQPIPNTTADVQQYHQVPILTSPKHDGAKGLLQPSSLLITPKTKPSMNGLHHDSTRTAHIHDLISSSTITTTQPSFIPSETLMNTSGPTASLSDIWKYTTASPTLSLTQTAAATAVAVMGLLNNENSQNTEIANEILKEILTTPAKQNNSADIDNKISAAMDLVKMHLLSAVREEVTELRQQIRTLNEKIDSIEHENTFLRQHVPSEIYAQYIPIFTGLSSSNDSLHSTTIPIPSLLLSPSSSCQSIPITALSSIPSALSQQPISLTTNLPLPLLAIDPILS